MPNFRATAVIDPATDGVLVEFQERLIYVNAAYSKMLGYRRPGELLNRPVADLISIEDADRLIRFGRTRVAGQAPSSNDFAALRRDGTTIRVQASVSVTLFNGNPYITTIVRPFASTRDGETAGPVAGAHDRLSERERVIIEKILAGKRPKLIAAELGLSEKTVATHRTRLRRKIGVSDNRELFQYALRHRLVDWS